MYRSFKAVFFIFVFLNPQYGHTFDDYTEAMLERVNQSILKETKQKGVKPEQFYSPQTSKNFKGLIIEELYKTIPQIQEFLTLDISVVDIQLVEITPQKFYEGVLKTNEPCVPCENGRGSFTHGIEVVLDDENYMVTIFE